MSSCRILVVGGGLTSAATVAALSQQLPQCSLTVWEKARGAGGRMSTSRSPNVSQCMVDLGAQYISASPSGQSAFKDIYSDLVESGTLTPIDTTKIQGFRLQPGYVHYTAPSGMSSVVKRLLAQSQARVVYTRRLSAINRQGAAWAATAECGHQEEFDGVVLTMPVPQILGLGGTVADILQQDPQVLSRLKDVEYSARFALGLFFDSNVDLATGWSSSYLSDHPVFRYISVDNLKRGKSEDPTSVLVHSSVPFGLKNIEVSPGDVQDQLVNAVYQLFPSWPPPAAVKCLKWRYSQVSKSYAGNPGLLMLSSEPPLVLAGDGFAATSNFEGCLSSAAATVASLCASLPK